MRVHAAVVACLFAGSVVFAAPLTVHNTGVNGSDVVQAVGSATSFWTLVSQPAGAGFTLGSTPFRYFNGAYYADNALSGWVSPAVGGNAGVGGNYVYELLVDLTGFNPGTALITGTFGTDNDGSIRLNGNAPAATTGFGAFGAPTAFSLTSGFIAGVNSIRVTVNNGGDPTALRVQFTSATADPGAGVPEPGTAVLVVSGLALAWAGRKRLSR